MMENRRVAIVDMDSLLYKSCWGNKLWDPQLGDWSRDEAGRLIYIEKTEEELVDSINKDLHNILQITGATHYILFVKGKNTASHRYEAKPDYKANRPKKSPDWWEFARNFIIDNWGAVSIDTLEVDDAVNITRLNTPNSFIVAIDKDLLSLQGEHYNWRTEEWLKISRSDELLFFWGSMITGDSVDGIEGLKGRGKAYFQKISNHLLKMDSRSVLSEELPKLILEEYIKHYNNENKAIQEFYKNYTCLKILEEYEGFEIPKPIIYIESNSEDAREEDLLNRL